LYTDQLEIEPGNLQLSEPHVAYFLAKTDPETYSIDQLELEHKTTWDGVTNAQAVRTIQQMRPGDRAFVYHSMGSPAIVGLAKVISEPRPDPKNPKSTVVDLEFLSRLEPPTTLAEIKGSKLFDDWALVRQSRLSTMSAPDTFVKWMKAKYPQTKM
jgi:predicted RNA-binding protein with PUA-like domain